MCILRFSLPLVFFFCIQFVYGQSMFYKVYSGLGYDVGKGVAELEDSSFVITGSSTSWEGSSQVYLMKIDSAGQREWTYNYGGPESDGASRVLFNKDIGIYTIGYTNSIGSGDYNGLVIKMDAEGNEIWQKSIGTADSWEFLHDAIFARDSSIVMVGESQNLADGDKDIYIVRIDRDGNTIWSNKIIAPGVDYATSIAQIEDSMFVVGGTFYCQDSLSQKAFIMKIDEDGTLQWLDTLGNYSGDYTIEDITVGIGAINAVGSREVGPDNHDSYLLMLDYNGNVLTQTTENDPNGESDVIMDEISFVPNLNKNVIGFRVVNAFSFQDDYDSNIAYFNESSLIWLNNFTSINYVGLDEVHQLMPTSDGGFIGVGQTTYPISGGSNIFVFKSSPLGEFPNTGEYYIIDPLVHVIESSEINSVRYFPNPVGEVFHVSFFGDNKKQLRFFDTLGQLAYCRYVSSGEAIDVSFLEKGVYYVLLESTTFKVVKL